MNVYYITKIIGIFGCRNRQFQSFFHNFVTMEGFDRVPCPFRIAATFINNVPRARDRLSRRLCAFNLQNYQLSGGITDSERTAFLIITTQLSRKLSGQIFGLATCIKNLVFHKKQNMFWIMSRHYLVNKGLIHETGINAANNPQFFHLFTVHF